VPKGTEADQVKDYCTRVGEIKAYSSEQVASLRAKTDDAGNAIQRLKEFDHEKGRTPCGYYFYTSVKKLEQGIYQDGTPIDADELSFYHGTNEGLVCSILTKGVCASIPSHGAEGLWVFSLLSPHSYDWGISPLQFFGGHVLHLKIPANLSTLRQNNRIRGQDKNAGHLRWVLNGKHLSPHLRCRIVGIYVRVPSQAYMQWIKGFKQCVRNCIPWCHLGTFDPRNQAVAQCQEVPGTKLRIVCKGKQTYRVLHCLGKDVVCRGKGKECLLYCVLEQRRKHSQDFMARILPGGTVPRSKKLPSESKMKAQLSMGVDRRLTYASAVSKKDALSADGADNILESSSDLFTGVRALSADIAATLYPLLQTSTASIDKIWQNWSNVPAERVPAPVMLFLTEAFPNTDWSIVFRTAKGASPSQPLQPCPSWLSLEKTRTRRRMGIPAGAAPEAHESADASSSASLTGVGLSTLPEASAPQRLECWYNFPWITHSGRMTGIYLTHSKPHFRFVCAGCFEHLQQIQTLFELFPSPEEQHQIVEDAQTMVPKALAGAAPEAHVSTAASSSASLTGVGLITDEPSLPAVEAPTLPYLAWVPFGGTPKRELRCLLCQKWVNDAAGHAGTREDPRGTIQHRKYLLANGPGHAWWEENVKAERLKWHPPPGTGLSKLEAVEERRARLTTQSAKHLHLALEMAPAAAPPRAASAPVQGRASRAPSREPGPVGAPGQ